MESKRWMCVWRLPWRTLSARAVGHKRTRKIRKLGSRGVQLRQQQGGYDWLNKFASAVLLLSRTFELLFLHHVWWAAT
jgi:hypothetical protein